MKRTIHSVTERQSNAVIQSYGLDKQTFPRRADEACHTLGDGVPELHGGTNCVKRHFRDVLMERTIYSATG